MRIGTWVISLVTASMRKRKACSIHSKNIQELWLGDYNARACKEVMLNPPVVVESLH